MRINSIVIIELGVNFAVLKSLIALNYSVTGVSDFEFQFNSTLSESLETIPTGLAVVLLGRNQAGQVITNNWAVAYNLTNCNTAPIYTPKHPIPSPPLDG
eukprot:scaffold56804_cov75-Attheya_sp.AAC.2